MELQSNESADSQYTYEIKGSSVDTLQKLRIGVGEMENNERFYIKKMRLVNQTTKTVLRFPSVDTEFESNQVYEFSPVYPDVQPALNILYTVTLMTTASTGTFRPSINIIGEEGDSGMRKFYDNIPYAEGSKHSFDADAVNLGPLQDVEVLIEGDEVRLCLHSNWFHTQRPNRRLLQSMYIDFFERSDPLGVTELLPYRGILPCGMRQMSLQLPHSPRFPANR
ncbi:unnamed protein product [Haemonchus placei]|uniref:FRAS1-related extracellular matrix protein 1 n=1 Tax=Haemonchus placei TaxID=6290 RepID=A0A0N4XBL2_HAEPC|nr:unnamed protein product [Haemonchus placei]